MTPLGWIDPTTFTVEELKARVRALLADPSLGDLGPVEPGHFRCDVCLRVLPRVTPDGEALAEMTERFGPLPEGEPVHVVCDDCDAIIGREMGLR